MTLGCQADMAAYLTLVVVILSPFLFRSNTCLRFHGKFFVYYIVSSIIAIFYIPLCVFKPRDVAHSRRATYVLRYVAPLIGVEFVLENPEILAERRGAFVVSNHQSTLDILGLFNIWEIPYKIAAIAKKEIFYVWPFGLGAWLCGVVFIDRSSPEKAYKTLRETSRLTSTDQTKIWVFPEGTRNKHANKTGQLLPFKRGAFKMAIDCQAPIIPVVYSPYYFLDRKTYYFGQGKIRIRALPHIDTKGLTEADVADLMEKTRQIMQKCYDEMFNDLSESLPKSHPFHLK